MLALSTKPANGVAGILDALTAMGYKQMSFDQLLMDFYIAVYLDDSLSANEATYVGEGHQYSIDHINLHNQAFSSKGGGLHGWIQYYGQAGTVK
jgi:hypothetical protein